MKRIRLIIVEDNRLLREGLTLMLKGEPDIAVTASLSSGEAILRGKHRAPDVILLDFVLRSHTSLQLVGSIKAKHPSAKVIVMDLGPIQPSLVDYVRAGVVGFVLKDATLKDFLKTIRDVAHGKQVLPSSLTSSLFTAIATHAASAIRGNPFTAVRMTSREKEVIELIGEGLSNKQIATRLTLAVDTVKSHIHNILEKLQLHTRLEIARYHNTSRADAGDRDAE